MAVSTLVVSISQGETFLPHGLIGASMTDYDTETNEELPPEVLMRGLLRAYYWMDESLQNGLQRAGYRPRTRTQTMILIHISNGGIGSRNAGINGFRAGLGYSF